MNLFAFFKVKNHGSAKKVRRPSEPIFIFQSHKCDFMQIVLSSNFVFHGKVKNLILRILTSNQCKSMKINENIWKVSTSMKNYKKHGII